VDSAPQLWTARVSCTKQDAVFAGMNTGHIYSSFLKVNRMSYQKIIFSYHSNTLLISVAPFKKYRNSQTPK
jgi:hypothetical protein